MPSTASQIFIEEFHNLAGLSVGEKRRNFYKLLNNNKHLQTNPTTVLDEIVENLTPRTYLEELFKLDLLIYYRRTNELFNIVKDGNEIFISKIVKHMWFFEEAFKDHDPGQLINELLPATSYSARMKILRKLTQSQQGERFDRIFDVLLKRYGQFIAHQFIFGCSDARIEQIIKDHRIQLNCKQLMILYRRNQQLTVKYFEYNPCSLYNYTGFFNYLFVNNYELFKQFDQKYRLSLRLGKRSTRRIVYNRKTDVIQSPDYYKQRINIQTALRKLRGDSRLLLNNAIVDMKKINEIMAWIRLFPRKYQWRLFKEIIMSRYSFDDYLPLIDERLIKIIDNSEDRALIVKRKILDGEQDFIKYLDLNESIPMIKERINLASTIPDRKRLIKQLVETCYYHQHDMQALCSIVKFFAFKHRNDDEYIQLEFLQTIRTTFGYHHLNDEIWKCLMEIYEIQKLKYNREIAFDDQLAYFEYLFNTNQAIGDDLLVAALKNREIDYHRYQHGKQFWKYLLTFVINNAEQLVDVEEDRRVKRLMLFDMHLISQMRLWNQQHPNDDDGMSFFNYPRIVDNFKLYLSTFRPYSMQEPLRHVILNKSLDRRHEYLTIFWGNLRYLGDTRILTLLLKYDVPEIVRNLDKFVEWCFVQNNDRRFWYKLKKYSHLQFDGKLIDLCLNDLDNEKSIECASVIMSGDKYQQLSEEYSQIQSKKLDLTNEHDKKLYKLRCSLAKFYKYTKYPKAIQSLLKYCIGDYLGSALTSLYSFMYHLPENRLSPILEIMSAKAVSCRKHSLFLACELCDYDTIKTIITMLNQNERSQSLQKRLIKTTMQYLKKNPTDQIYELVQLNIQFTKKDDDDLLGDLIDIDQLPKPYVARYAEFIWGFINSLNDRPTQFRRLKQQLLRKYDAGIIQQLPLAFCQKIVEDHFLKTSVITTEIMHTFLLKLFTCKEKQLPILQQVLQILDRLARDDCSKVDFMANYFDSFMKCESVDFLQIVVDYWEKLVDPVAQFESYVNIFFVKLKILCITNNSVDVDAIVERILQFFNDLVVEYSQFIVDIFANLMAGAIGYFTNDFVDKYDYYEKLLLNNLNNINVVMLVLHWLPESCPSSKSAKYSRILRKIQTIQDPVVRIVCKKKFDRKPYLYSEDYIEMDTDWD